VALGLRHLLGGHFSREAVIRVIAPIEDARFFELPATVAALAVKPGERVLDASFDHAYSISVLEHIAEDGDIPALAELARVVKPEGRIVLDRLLASTSQVQPLGRRAVTYAATRLYRFYQRNTPASLVLCPLLGMTLRVVEGTPGLMFVTLLRKPATELSGAGG